MPLDTRPGKDTIVSASLITRSVATLAVSAGLLVAAGPAHAGTFVGNPGDAPSVACDGIGAIVYNGHAGLGANGFVVQNGKASPGGS